MQVSRRDGGRGKVAIRRGAAGSRAALTPDWERSGWLDRRMALSSSLSGERRPACPGCCEVRRRGGAGSVDKPRVVVEHGADVSEEEAAVPVWRVVRGQVRQGRKSQNSEACEGSSYQDNVSLLSTSSAVDAASVATSSVVDAVAATDTSAVDAISAEAEDTTSAPT